MTAPREESDVLGWGGGGGGWGGWGVGGVGWGGGALPGPDDV
jgi:hypothetical protein